jgi:hypothetical protein
MCDSATIQIIEEVVEEKVRAGEMFTAFDISLEVKKRGGTDRHRHMKRIVHDYHDRGLMGAGYTRTLITIPGAKAQAYLYYHKSDDPSAYKAQLRRRRGSDSGFRADRRARLCVPVYWLRAVGLLPGKQAYVASDTSSHALVLTRDKPDPSSTVVLQTYKVEKDGNVRIAKTTLARAGLTGKSYDIDGDSTRVMLRLHKPAKSK